ncbi:MAG: cytochrome c [SAR324 cluster bacterium]|nr:cytochrome c [SAR324 cluster bacterium]
MLKTAKLIRMIPFLLLALSLSSQGWANPPNRPYSDPYKGGYNFKNDGTPWFDGKDYPYFLDMFDGKGIKPQQEGTYQQFPKGSVPVKFTLGKLDKAVYEAILPFAEREIKPQNPTEASPESIARGRLLYDTYCAVCHGKAGIADTPVAQKSVGKLAIPPDINPLLKVFGGPHLYNKIRYGSYYNTGTYQPTPGLMPSYGVQTSSQDRWDMVNYLKSPNFGKEEN